MYEKFAYSFCDKYVLIVPPNFAGIPIQLHFLRTLQQHYPGDVHKLHVINSKWEKCGWEICKNV